MDDIQMWIYIAFGIIYFIGKNFRKAKKKEEPELPTSPLETENTQTEQPLSFEELFEQITGQKQAEKKYVEEESPYEAEPEPVVEAEPEAGSLTGTRHFSDDESRRIYEKSVALAEKSLAGVESAHLSAFKGKEKGDKSSNYGKDIRKMFATKSDSRKAVILSEILNRKY